jgi:hypothetical protein
MKQRVENDIWTSISKVRGKEHLWAPRSLQSLMEKVEKMDYECNEEIELDCQK